MIRVKIKKLHILNYFISHHSKTGLPKYKSIVKTLLINYFWFKLFKWILSSFANEPFLNAFILTFSTNWCWWMASIPLWCSTHQVCLTPVDHYLLQVIYQSRTPNHSYVSIYKRNRKIISKKGLPNQKRKVKKYLINLYILFQPQNTASG